MIIILPDKRGITMQTLTKQVLEHATGLPEGTPLVAKELLHLGSRAAVDQVLSRLVRRGVLLRVGCGIYALPVESRFGTRAPSTVKMVEGLANQRGETIVSHGAAAANALGLTTQVPMRAVYLLSLIHISEPTRLGMISYAVFCLKKKKKSKHPTQLD